ncbi:hypothetical protein B0H66DRAFT_499810 [Apodospora peruviana]|uniref:Phytanoyl-CoA dioxygenase n=1 Tax=Apodospora peruviana TaxID=516989 RepID=A0AAE0M2J7_9PEZI|nr:hypothetical protein B0H66DRAFT_499810 [Apodospora peruviana]
MATTPASSSSSSSDDLLNNLHKTGFIIIRSILSPEELSSLRTAASQITALARQGSWPHIRTVGKQFPPWPSTPDPETGIWGVQHLLHPSLPIPSESRAAFCRLYFSPSILGVVKQLLQTTSDSDLVMELCNMLVRPDTDFELRWHRDDIPWNATPQEEEARLVRPDGTKYLHTQWNLPLYDDGSLILIPGSHRRARTEAERNAGPYEENLPDQITVHLKAGDIAFYDNDILHRAVYSRDKERMTLHGSVGHIEANKARARNVLQHGVGEWVDRCDFTGLLEGNQRRVAEGMGERLVAMGRENTDVGYSLSG